MNWYTVFYLFSLADKIESTFYTLAVFFIAIFVAAFLINVVLVMNDEPVEDPARRVCRKWMWLSGILITVTWGIWAFVPGRNDMLLIIAGGSVGEFVATDENAKEIPADITRFLRKEILEATANSSEEVKKALGIEHQVDTLKQKSKEELIEIIEQTNN